MFEILKYLGKFHPVILHLPIGALYFTFCLALVERFFKDNFSVPIRIGLAFSFVFAVISCLLGYFLSFNGGYGEETLNIHMWLGISTAIFNGILLWVHKQSTFGKHFIPFFGITIILLSITGHFGGTMTHGEDFLKPPKIKNELVFNIKDSINLYSEVVRPVLDNKCVKCHNPSKSKGGLLMNNKEGLLNGGKSGNILFANNSLQSHLYSYLVLPSEDELHMPPKGNSQLKKYEIELIKYWIDSGADFERFDKTKESNEVLALNLASFFPKTIAIAPPPTYSNLQNLQNLNFRIERNSNENNFIEAKFLGEDIQTKHLNALLKIKHQLIKLDLSNTNLNDRKISKIKKLEKLKYLKINNTDITDKGLISINKSIESLNLNNTLISYNGLQSFLESSQTKNVYLWNTKIKPEQESLLEDQFSANLNFGIKDFSSDMPLLQPIIMTEQTLFTDSLLVKFYKPLGNPEIRYTTDGKAPDSLSNLYSKPFSIKKSLTLRALAFKKGWKKSKPISVDYFETGGTFTKYSLKVSPSKTYSNPEKLFDRILGTTNFREGNWNGFIKEKDVEYGSPNPGDMIVEINMPKGNKINAIGINALTSVNDYITFPKRIELYDISSGKDVLLSFKNIASEGLSTVPTSKMFIVPLNKKNINKIKLIVKSNKSLPKGHPAEGEFAWLFVSEIIGLL